MRTQAFANPSRELNAPTIEFHFVQPLLAARWRGAQRRRSWWQVTRKHVRNPAGFDLCRDVHRGFHDFPHTGE
jgi:hypothetical protein